MPYIPHERRAALDVIIDGLVNRIKQLQDIKRGDLNYVVTRLVLETLNHDSYHSLSDCVSVLRDAADEIARRLLGPYEDTAILKNGDMECFQKPYAHKPLRPVDPLREKSRDEWEKYCASYGGCPPPPGYEKRREELAACVAEINARRRQEEIEKGITFVEESEADKFHKQFIIGSKPVVVDSPVEDEPLLQVADNLAAQLELQRERLRQAEVQRKWERDNRAEWMRADNFKAAKCGEGPVWTDKQIAQVEAEIKAEQQAEIDETLERR